MRFSKVAKFAVGLGGVAGRVGTRGMGVGFLGLAAPVTMAKRTMMDVGKLGANLIKDPKSAAITSMKLLGTAAGVTYATRMLRGGSLFRNRRGKRDIVPFVPYV